MAIIESPGSCLGWCRNALLHDWDSEVETRFGTRQSRLHESDPIEIDLLGKLVLALVVSEEQRDEQGRHFWCSPHLEFPSMLSPLSLLEARLFRASQPRCRAELARVGLSFAQSGMTASIACRNHWVEGYWHPQLWPTSAA